MSKSDTDGLKELINKTKDDWKPVSVRPVKSALTARGLIEGMKMICDDNPNCRDCPLAWVSSCVSPDPEVIDIVSNYLDNKYFGGEGMTRELLNKANAINHDIKVLQNIKAEKDRNHWVGFCTPNGDEDSFYSPEMQVDLKNFIESELEKAQKLLEEL